MALPGCLRLHQKMQPPVWLFGAGAAFTSPFQPGQTPGALSPQRQAQMHALQHSGDPWTHSKVFPGTQTPFSAWVGRGEQEKARKAPRWLCPSMQKGGEVTNTCSDPTNTDSPSDAPFIAGGMVC